MLFLDPERFTLLRTVAVDFFVIVVCLAIISAILLQGFHELLRARVNKKVLRDWLRNRKLPLDVGRFCAEMGGSGTTSLSLPYWQFTGQIAAALSSQLNLFPSSQFVQALANTSEDYPKEVYQQLEKRGVPAENLNAAVLRDVAARAQAGINLLHLKLRIKWSIFDYLWSLGILIALGALLTGLQETQGQRASLYAALVVAWLAAPIMRRMLENFVPFSPNYS